MAGRWLASWWRVLPALVAASCAGAPAGTASISPVPVQGARLSPAPLAATLRLPDGPRPHPVVILLHGCGGLGANQGLWADRLAGWGYGSLVLDSFTPRAIRTVCAPSAQPLVTRSDRAGDVIAAAQWLQSQPGVDGKRIAVLGDSHGGSTAATIASRRFEDQSHGLVRAAIDYYGACRDPAGHGSMPLLALAGEDDTWGDPAASCRRFKATVGSAEDVEVHTYPDTVHGFENPRNIRRTVNAGHPIQYNQGPAEDSYRAVHAFLGRTLGPS